MKALGAGGRRPGLGAAQPRRLVPAAHDLLRPARAVRRRLAAGLQVAGPARRRPATAPSRPRRRSSPSSARFAAGTPELGKNLSIVLQHLDDRKYAVEKDPRSPGGQGYTGLEALLQYVYDQTTSTSIFDQNNHILKVGAFVGPCADYASEETLKKNPDLERQCGSRLGPIQPGLNYPDVDQARRAGGQGPRGGQARRRRPRPAAARRPGARRRARAGGARDARRRPDAVAAERPDAVDADGADADRPGRAAHRPCRRCPASAAPAATIAAAPRRSRRCPSSARRPAATRRPRPSSSTTC